MDVKRFSANCLLQLLFDTSTHTYHFWTRYYFIICVVIISLSKKSLCFRWGRVGEGGQSSLISTYGNNKDAAVNDFKKKFKVLPNLTSFATVLNGLLC